MLEWLVVFGLGGIASLFSKAALLSDRPGGIVIPVSQLPEYQSSLEPGVYSAVLIRQSGNVHADLGGFLTPSGALTAAIKPLHRAGITELRVVHVSSTKLAAYRRIPHLKGTAEGRKLGGIQVVRERDYTEKEAAFLSYCTPEAFAEREASRQALLKEEADERQRSQKDATVSGKNKGDFEFNVKRADLDEILAEEEQSSTSAYRMKFPTPTLDEMLERGRSRLEAWRNVRELTVFDLAAATKIPQRILTQIENRTRRPSSQQIVLLAEALSVSPSDIEDNPTEDDHL